MIEANELRIGNKVFDKEGRVRDVCGIQYPYAHLVSLCNPVLAGSTEFNDIDPIPLTEETLLKCGFEKELLDDDEDYYYSLRLSDHEYCGLSLLSGDRDGVLEVFIFPYENIRYKYLHEVQNAYHSLTGKELEVKI